MAAEDRAAVLGVGRGAAVRGGVAEGRGGVAAGARGWVLPVPIGGWRLMGRDGG